MKIILVIIAILMSLHLQAKTLVVSDIDDTIKISRVIDTSDMIFYGLQTRNAFYGMAEVYGIIKKQIQDVDFVYLSNAPEILMNKRHQKFLTRHQFPSGELIVRKSGQSADNHKILQIRKKIKSGKYDQLILIGDNGERDAFVYHQAAIEFPLVKIATYVHQVYSVNATDDDFLGTELFAEQVGFVTPVEIALDLATRKIISYESAKSQLGALVANIQKLPLDQDGGVISFPAWMDCRDFQWKWTIPADNIQLMNFSDYILSRCQEDPSETYIQVDRTTQHGLHN